MLAGNWAEARRIVDELMPAYEESPFWIEPQTRVCRARMLIAEGAVEAAVVDADRAVAVVRGKIDVPGSLQPARLPSTTPCRARGDERRSASHGRAPGRLEGDAVVVSRQLGARPLVRGLVGRGGGALDDGRRRVPDCRPVARRRQRVRRAGLRQGRCPAGVDGCHLGRRHGQAVGGRVAGRTRASRGRRCAARARASFLAFGRRVAVSTQVRVVARCRLLERDSRVVSCCRPRIDLVHGFPIGLMYLQVLGETNRRSEPSTEARHTSAEPAFADVGRL